MSFNISDICSFSPHTKEVNMRFVYCLLFIFSTSICFGQVGMLDWRLYTPANNAIDIANSSEKVYAAMTNGLYEYDIQTGENYLWTKANYLSDINLSCIAYDNTSSTLIIGYTNGNLDLLHDNTIYNIPSILLSSILGDKKINRIVPIQNFVYVVASFGIIKLDPVKREIKDTYFPNDKNKAIIDLAMLNDTLYALTSDTIYKGAYNNSFLAAPSQWSVVNNVPHNSTGSFQFLSSVNNHLFLGYNHPIYGKDTVYESVNGVFTILTGVFANSEIKSITPLSSGFLFSTLGSVFEFDANGNKVQQIYQYNEGEYVTPSRAIKIGVEYYIADLTYGLVKATNSFANQKIGFSGPLKNNFYSMDWHNGKLAIASGQLEGNQNTYNVDGLQLLEDGSWKTVNRENQPIMQNSWDLVCTAIDPNDNNHIICGSYSPTGVFEMTDGANFATSFDQTNSLLELNLLGNNLCYVNNVRFDDASNCWVGQSYVNTPLKVKSSDGTWYAFDCGSAVKSKRLNNLQIDFNGLKWLSFSNTGLLAYDDNKTISDPSDDRYKLLTTGEGYGDLPSNSVLCATADYDNKIWIGTDFGLVVLYSVDNIFKTDGTNFDAKKILIEVAGEVESLLGETVINDIKIDGGNRKWIATSGAGVLLLSPDGTEQIHRFTAENSPLISNTVLDIEINDVTGEVYFATDKGLISFRSDASFGDSDYKEVKVFPNPVLPNFFGPITIQGIAYNSDVKITDLGGNLVYQTTSNGGTAIWSGNTLDGKRAKSGVYLIWTAENKGKGRKVGKVVFINEE